MKKLLIALLALTVVGAAFAADPALTFSGSVKTGVNFVTGDSAEDGAWSAFNDDAGKAFRLELVGAYTDGDFGAKFRLRGDNVAELDMDVSYGYVWGNMFSNLVTMKAGIIDDGAWATEGDDGFDVADGSGLQIQVKPMAGLNFGVKLSAPPVGSYTTKQFMNEAAVGLGYTSDMFNFQAGYKMDSDFDGNDDNAFAYFGANYKGVKGLKLIAEAKLTTLGAYSDSGMAEINEIVEYAVSDMLSAGIVSYQWVPGNSDVDLAYSVKPYANYKMNDVTTLGLAVSYASLNADDSEIYVKPSATFQLAPKAKIASFLKYNMADVSGTKTNDTTVQFDFIWSF